jgi:hypothetical protein
LFEFCFAGQKSGRAPSSFLHPQLSKVFLRVLTKLVTFLSTVILSTKYVATIIVAGLGNKRLIYLEGADALDLVSFY